MLLEDLSVDRIEVASARVSDGEFGSVKEIAKWAKSKKMLDRVEVLGFVDGLTSLNWIKDAGCQVINLLCKGSLKHCKYQLKKTVEQHIADIKEVVSNAEKMGITVNVYLEDWSNGIQESPEYVFQLMDGLKDLKIKSVPLIRGLSGILYSDEKIAVNEKEYFLKVPGVGSFYACDGKIIE